MLKCYPLSPLQFFHDLNPVIVRAFRNNRNTLKHLTQLMKCNFYYLTFLLKAQIFITFLDTAIDWIAPVNRTYQLLPLSTGDYEATFWADHSRVCGIDEAGRGPLAGPVVAAAVVFPRFFRPNGIISTLNDSKIITPEHRESLASAIEDSALDFSISVIDHSTIDRMNIFRATMLAMNEAAESLQPLPELMMIDGNRFTPQLPIPYLTIVKGDAKVFSIAAASILAKTSRDRIMKEYAREYPQYGFERHFGYATKAHVAAIAEHGRCPLHRKSFRLKQLGEK